MSGILRRIERDEELRLLEIKMNSSRLNGKQGCSQSGFCCFRRPPIPSPDELIQISEHFKMEPKQFIEKYCTIDRLSTGTTYYAKFVGKISQKYVGQFLPSQTSWNEGACIFLSDQRDDGKYDCTINNVKPYVCRTMECWDLEGMEKAPDATEQWKDNALVQFGFNGAVMEEEEE